MWELEFIPVYLLLSMWGGKKHLYSATKKKLHTTGGSVFLKLQSEVCSNKVSPHLSPTRGTILSQKRTIPCIAHLNENLFLRGNMKDTVVYLLRQVHSKKRDADRLNT